MLPAEKYKLLRLASEAKSKLNYKFCWSTDTRLIFLKKDETSLPILIRDESSLAAINYRADDWLQYFNPSIFDNSSSFHLSTSSSFLIINSLKFKVDFINYLHRISYNFLGQMKHGLQILSPTRFSHLVLNAEDPHLFHDHQFGFCAGLGTSSAILHLLEYIRKGFDCKLITLALFVDLRRALNVFHIAVSFLS